MPKKKNSNRRHQIIQNAKTCVICLENNEGDWIQCFSYMELAYEACADISKTKQELCAMQIILKILLAFSDMSDYRELSPKL